MDEEGDIGLLGYVVDGDREAEEGAFCEQEANAAAAGEVVDDLKMILARSCLGTNDRDVAACRPGSNEAPAGVSKVPPSGKPVQVRTCTRPA